MSLSEILIEQGVGETRALVLDDRGAIAEAHVERAGDQWRFGDVVEARLATILVPGVRGIAFATGREALLEPLPRSLTEGATVRIEIVREPFAEAGRRRLAKAIVATRRVGNGASLATRMAALGLPIRLPAAHENDAFEAAGWSEVVEAALTGRVDFDGGSLTISPTPGMTVIDVDGVLPAADLALAAATATAAAIQRFDLSGSIGIDFPTVGDKAVRARIGDLLDAGLGAAGRFERTSVNGFGFVQLIRPKRRPSFVDRLRDDPVQTAALRLLRQAERSRGVGERTLAAAPSVTAWLEAQTGLLAELEGRLGTSVALHTDPRLAIFAGYVSTSA